VSLRLLWSMSLLAVLGAAVAPLSANVYPIILRGKVTTDDGSAPAFTVGTERICSDGQGSAPGPTTNKKGEYEWRMEIDPLATRACSIRATHAGWVSTSIEVQGLDTTKTMIMLPPLVISPSVPDAYSINASETNVPLKAKTAFKAAMKALDEGNTEETARQLEAATAAAPKFAQGWHALGIVLEELRKPADARAAYEHAIESDPKMLPAYVTLARTCLKLKDWDCSVKEADNLIKADTKHIYPEIYMHRAVARYELKDLAGAAENAQEAVRLDPRHKKPRAEYILGRILEAQGDLNGARGHISKYLELDPNAPDVDVVRAHLQGLGKPDQVEPDLEIL